MRDRVTQRRSVRPRLFHSINNPTPNFPSIRQMQPLRAWRSVRTHCQPGKYRRSLQDYPSNERGQPRPSGASPLAERRSASGVSNFVLCTLEDWSLSIEAMVIHSSLMKCSPVCRTIQINGKQHYLWRAVDQDGDVIDVYLQAKRDGVAHRELIPDTIHSTEQYENNRAEQSHEVTRV